MIRPICSIGGTVYYPFNLIQPGCRKTHGTGFNGCIEREIEQLVAVKRLAGALDDQRFGMGGHVIEFFNPIMFMQNNFTPCIHQNATEGWLAAFYTSLSFGQRRFHIEFLAFSHDIRLLY